MAPIRRYLRITKYSILECRIYLDNPALAESWLLNSRSPVLPRVIESVRPLVLPKLREENERQKGKGGSKKKGLKDVQQLMFLDDFEVSIFLTETSTRHSLLTKRKLLLDPNKKPIQSNSSKLTGDTKDTAIDIDDEPVIRREEGEGGCLGLQDLPAIEETSSDTSALFVSDDEGPRRSKRPRTTVIDSEDDGHGEEHASKQRKVAEALSDEETEDKKKMAMKTTYDGFAIYGRVLCLVIKRKDRKGKAVVSGGQAMMEEWITSTQVPLPLEEE
ncbi:hypothetical protein B0O99DRAFT_649040 [Bisporella sp. PMI_857]|nr:hypothetical protein B0O99DRAFT_649040 [Bisporella sp. PMI_857]